MYGHLIGTVLAIPILLILLAGCGAASADVVVAPAPLESERARTAERLVAVIDYVASDYRGAVPRAGEVADPAEYDEQISMVASARALAKELPGFAGGADLEALEAAVKAKGDPDGVARACGRVRAAAITGYAVSTAPTFPPSFARGEAIFKSACVDCHGKEGRGDGLRATKDMDPAPANLRDPERMAAVPPYRVYCDVTYGIAGTAMPALAVTAADRWSIAFYASALRHLQSGATPADADPARAAPAPGAPAPGLATLAASTDAELEAILARTIPDERARRLELARLRVVASFAASTADAPAAYARRAIAEARDTAIAGRRAEADRLVVDAYLRGIEEIEAPLRARDPGLVTGIEEAVARLRAAIAAPPSGPTGSADAVAAKAGELVALIERAEQGADANPAGAAMLGLAAALLVLREGLEAALIVASILAVVRRTGLPGAAGRAVHAGWTSALLAGGLTFVAARTAITALATSRELVEAAVSILAALVLFATSFWLIAKADARRWVAYVKARASGSAAQGGTAGLFAVAFLATYREAFESVLFFEALLGGEAARAVPLALGAIAGAVGLGFAVHAILTLERRLPIGPFFGVSGALLSALSVVLLGHGVHALEASSLLVPRPIDGIRIEWLGVYPDALSLGAQAALLAAIAVALAAVRLLPPPIETPAAPQVRPAPAREPAATA